MADAVTTLWRDDSMVDAAFITARSLPVFWNSLQKGCGIITCPCFPCGPAAQPPSLPPWSWRGQERWREEGRVRQNPVALREHRLQPHDCRDRKGAKRAQGLPTVPSSKLVTGLRPGARLPFSWRYVFLQGRQEVLPR